MWRLIVIVAYCRETSSFICLDLDAYSSLWRLIICVAYCRETSSFTCSPWKTAFFSVASDHLCCLLQGDIVFFCSSSRTLFFSMTPDYSIHLRQDHICLCFLSPDKTLDTTDQKPPQYYTQRTR